MSSSEIEKIDLFISEALRHWMLNPQFVSSEQFFRMWQSNCSPRPFRLPSGGLHLAGKHVLFGQTTEDQQAVVYVDWNADLLRPMVVCEWGYESKTRVICVDENGLSFPAGPDLDNPLEDNLLGSHVEAMAEVARLLRERYSSFDLSNARDVLLREALTELYGASQDKVFKELLRNGAGERKRLMRKVIADMAEDEFSAQLTLGLEFQDEREVESDLERRSIPPCTLPPRGSWDVDCDLQLLCDAERERLNVEESIYFGMVDVQALTPLIELRQIIKMPIPSGLEEFIREGTRFMLFKSGAPRTILGMMQLDVVDNGFMYCSLSWDKLNGEGVSIDDSLLAMPRKSPQDYIVRALDIFRQTVSSDAMSGMIALRSALGIMPMPYVFPPPGLSKRFPHLDDWQACACESCVDETNPVVVVQGPPGTGKTYVLESVVREFARRGQKILVTAPSNTAVDNICKRLLDLPILRQASQKEIVAETIGRKIWAGDEEAVREFERRREEQHCEIHAGTHVGILRSPSLIKRIETEGVFDVIVFDEAGMSRTGETLLCLALARRACFFGDPQQLPPHPLPERAWGKLRETHPVVKKSQEDFIGLGFLSWLQIHRRFPAIMLRTCFRCQNPRLMRFSSYLFYNALVKTAGDSSYFKMSYRERQRLFPALSLRFMSTSGLPEDLRREELTLDRMQPGFQNTVEAKICARLVLDALERMPLSEITVISPYKKQVRLIRKILKYVRPEGETEESWHAFRHERIATVDSFQGGESDLVIISYVRSGGNSVGFVDDPNRVNVTHTRARKEMVVIGDLEFLKSHADNRIFQRMGRSFQRDGVIADVSLNEYQQVYDPLEIPDEVDPFAQLYSELSMKGKGEGAKS